MTTELKLEDFFPMYVKEEDEKTIYDIEGDPFYNSIIYKKEFDDVRAVLNEPKPMRGDLLKHQAFMQRFMSPYTPYDRMLVFHGLGSGKCFGIDTPIMMYDGTIKKVQDVKVGDVVMGDDSTPRNVLSLATGEDELYEIVSNYQSKYKDNFIVNSEHILCLRSLPFPIRYIPHATTKKYKTVRLTADEHLKFITKSFKTLEEAEEYYKPYHNDYITIKVSDYLKLPQKKKDRLKSYKAVLQFPERKVSLDPYVLGFWLGLPKNKKAVIFTEDSKKITKQYDGLFASELEEEFEEILLFYNLMNNSGTFKNVPGTFNKHIPEEYKLNSTDIRLKLLAGIIDSCMSKLHVHNIYYLTQIESETLANDIIFLARSLGYHSHSETYELKKDKKTCYKVTISGKNIELIKSRIHRKTINVENAEKRDFNNLEFFFKIHSKGVGKYYGFTVDGNHKFLLGNFVVTHNSCLLTSVAEYAKLIRFNELSKNKVIILVRNPSLKKNIMNEIACICTKNIYEPSAIDPKTGEKRDKDSMRKSLGRNIAVNYEIMTFTSFSKIITNLSNEQIKDQFSYRYFLIDEAHNIRLQPQKQELTNTIAGINEKKSISNYKEIHRCLHNIIGSKVLLLTATPMRDQPSEICQILNLLLPLNKQLDKKTFLDKYFISTNDGKKVFNPELKIPFKDTYLKGLVSYLRSSTSDIQIKYEGDIDVDRKMKYTKTVRLEMEEIQEDGYKEAYQLDAPKSKINVDEEVDEEDIEGDGERGSGIWVKSRQASSFVSPDGTYGILKENPLATYQKGDFVLSPSIHNFLTKYGEDHKNMLNQLKKCSVKYWYVVRDILRYPNEKFFIYSNIVQGGGCILLSALLKLFGLMHASIKESPEIKDEKTDSYCPDKKTISSKSFEELKTDMEKRISKNKNRFITLTGSTVTDSNLDTLVNDIFNSKANTYGDFIRVIIGSHIVGEGISFKHIRRMYVITPFWNSATTEQAIGRAIRYKSHEDLPPSLQNVTVYRLAAEPLYDPSTRISSIDMQMYKMSEDKDIRIKQVERLLKENAVDCSLNRNRNLLETDVPNSKECDYEELCEYKCDYVDEKYVTADWIGTRITDTYNLYYAEKEIQTIVSAVQHAFLYKFAYDFEELLEKIKDEVRDIPAIVLARGLNHIIINNIFVLNKFGFINFLREDRNMFFLVDDPLAPSIFTSYYYSKHIDVKDSLENFDKALEYLEYEKVPEIMNLLTKYQTNKAVLQTIFKNINESILQNIVETFFISYVEGLGSKNKSLQDFIIENYSMYFKKKGKSYLSILDPDHPKLLVKEDDTYVWIEAEEEQIKEVETERKSKIDELRSNPLGYYAVISTEYSGKDDYKNLKIVEVRERISKTGKVDKRLEKEGTSCGTGEFSLSGIIKMYYNIIKKARDIDISIPLFDDKEYTLEELRTASAKKSKKTSSGEKISAFDSYLFPVIRDDIVTNFLIKEIKNKNDVKTYLTQFANTVQGREEKKELLEFSSSENIEGFVKGSVKSKENLVEYVFNTSYNEFVDSIKDEIEIEINSLSPEEINGIGGLLTKSATDVCKFFKQWFIDNDLYVYSSK